MLSYNNLCTATILSFFLYLFNEIDNLYLYPYCKQDLNYEFCKKEGNAIGYQAIFINKSSLRPYIQYRIEAANCDTEKEMKSYIMHKCII